MGYGSGPGASHNSRLATHNAQVLGNTRRGAPWRGDRTALGRAGGAATLTAAATSRRPHPKTGFGTLAPENPPQSCVEVSGTAVRSSTFVVAATWPINCGAADQRRATAPVTCGAEPDVPEKEPVNAAGGAATRPPTPGAD